MTPTDFFGGVPLTGKLSIVPVGAQCGFTETSYRGPGRISAVGAYTIAQFSAFFLGRHFTLVGNVAEFRFQANALSDLDLFASQLDALFPELFSGAFHAPIDIEDISGTLLGFKFTVRSSLTYSNSVTVTPQTLPLKEYFDNVVPQDFVPDISVISAFRYLQQADRLEAEGRYMTTFLAERILNLAKSLEALFPGEIDIMRTELWSLGAASTYSDIFASVRYLRNQVDVGHVSFSDLPKGSVQEVFQFVGLATSCLRALLNSLLRNQPAQERLLTLRKGSTSTKVPNAVAYLRHYAGMIAPKDNDLTVAQKI